MSKYKKRWIIFICILSGVALVALALVAAGFRRLEAYEYGLDYSYITGASLAAAQSSGTYYISFTHKFIKFNRTQQSLQLTNITSLTSDQIRTTSDVQVSYWLTSFTGDDLLNYYINFGEQPEVFLKPIFSNSVHKSISTMTINDLKSFDDSKLANQISAAISAAVSPLVPMGFSVSIDAFTSAYQNRTAAVEVAQLKRRNQTLNDLYKTISSINPGADYIYRTQQTIIQSNTTSTNRVANELANLNSVLQMFKTANASGMGFPRLYQMMMSSNQSYYQDKLMPNYIRYGSV